MMLYELSFAEIKTFRLNLCKNLDVPSGNHALELSKLFQRQFYLDLSYFIIAPGCFALLVTRLHLPHAVVDVVKPTPIAVDLDGI